MVGKHNTLLTGTPDVLFTRSDRSHLIVDYKTGTFRAAQDEFLLIYRAQRNAYALLSRGTGHRSVQALKKVGGPCREPPFAGRIGMQAFGGHTACLPA